MHHYVIVRADLSRGQLGAQIVHAAGESAALVPPTQTTHAVVLQADDEAVLQALEAILRLAQVAFVAIREPDAPFFGQLVAIGLAPIQRTSRLKKILSRFQLLS